MKRIPIAICLTALLCTATTVRAQWVTFDPSNLAQSIVNTTRNLHRHDGPGAMGDL